VPSAALQTKKRPYQVLEFVGELALGCKMDMRMGQIVLRKKFA
jgi:hypothetical protein